MVKLSIVIPIYNEQGSIQATIGELKQAMAASSLPYEIIAVDDGSRDRTPFLLKQIKGIKIVTHPQNQGYGASLKSGIHFAKGSYIAITDADGTYPNLELGRLLQHISKFDMVVGARIGKNVAIPLARKPAKFILSTISNLLVGKKIPDLNSGFRVFKKELAEKFMHLLPNGFSFTTTITLASLCNNYQVKYIPISYKKRKGVSTIHPIKDFLAFLTLIIRIVTYFNPLKMFSLCSLFLFVTGLLLFVYDISYRKALVHDVLIVVIAVAAVQIFLLGILADLITKQRDTVYHR